MTVLSAQTIKKSKIFVKGVSPRWRHPIGVSGGLGACTYDLMLGEDCHLFPIFRSFAVVSAFEEFNMPHNVVGIVHDKSTWARAGVCVQNTLIDPGFRGTLMLELTLHSWRPRFLEKGTPIAQVCFHFLDQPTEAPYEGKYQDQQAGTKAIFEKR